MYIQTKTYHGPDRRKGPDWWVKSLTWLALTGWGIIVTTLILIEKAKPHIPTAFDKWLKARGPFNYMWNRTLTEYIFYLMVSGFILSIVGMIINIKRHRRRTDQYRFSIIIFGILSLIGILVYVF